MAPASGRQHHARHHGGGQVGPGPRQTAGDLHDPGRGPEIEGQEQRKTVGGEGRNHAGERVGSSAMASLRGVGVGAGRAALDGRGAVRRTGASARDASALAGICV